jgi:hypothetical protein
MVRILILAVFISAQAQAALIDTVIKNGVPRDVAEFAFQKLELFKDKVTNNAYMAIIDFRQHSGQRRFYLINRSSGAVEKMSVAHGTASDPQKNGYAQYFSNIPNSKMSSLGAYIVAEKYKGKHGYSMRLDGLESTNDNARDRAIVLHPAEYVKDGKSKQGWSWGCPAVPHARMANVIARLQGGAFLYAYGINAYRETKRDLIELEMSKRPGYQWVDESEDAPIDGD